MRGAICLAIMDRGRQAGKVNSRGLYTFPCQRYSLGGVDKYPD